MPATQSRKQRKRFTPQLTGDASIVPVQQVHALDPSWPFSVWSTRELMKSGRLGCKRVGKRYFVTRAHLEAFVRGDQATTQAA